MRGEDRGSPTLPFFAPLLLVTILACVTRRVDMTLLHPIAEPYSASLRVTATIGQRGFTASGGCAVDPARGCRVELRDPAGSARLLLLVTRDRATLIAPQSGLTYPWSHASREMPFSSAGLWFALTGRPPSGMRDLQATEEGLKAASWNEGGGEERCQFTLAPGLIIGHSAATLRGAGGSILKLEWKDVQPGSFREGALEPPANLALTLSSAGALLDEIAK